MGGITPVVRKRHNNLLVDLQLVDFKHKDLRQAQLLQGDLLLVNYRHKDLRLVDFKHKDPLQVLYRHKDLQ